MQRILLVEDSDEARMVVLDTLGRRYDVAVAGTVDEALGLLVGSEFSLILLDLTLPKKDGYALLTALQEDPRMAAIPVICLTGKSEVASKAAAFSLGVEDYIVKPFDTMELRIRVEARLKKAERTRERSDLVVVGRLRIDRDRHRVTCVHGGTEREIALTPREFKLLLHMARAPERVFTREQLIAAAWSNEAAVFDRAVDVHIHGVRKKLGDLGHYLQAVPGVGYKLTDADNPRKKAA